jgi:hypothetical protein
MQQQMKMSTNELRKKTNAMKPFESWGMSEVYVLGKD